MTLSIIKLILSLLVISVLGAQSALAVKIVRLDLEYGSDSVIATGAFDIPKTTKTLYFELFDDIDGLGLTLFDGLSEVVAPTATVANYLNYVNSGRYDSTFFTRSVPSFILQAGGAANKPADPDNDDIVKSVVAVEDLSPVVNEPGISNLRGTIAMARAGGQINSATNEWFINLGDNSSLDVVDEGFTVFGRVIDELETIDQLVSFPTTGILSLFLGGKVPGTAFNELPIADANLSNVRLLFRRNLLLITSVTEINRPILRFTPDVSNFGSQSTDSVTTGKTIDIVLKNTGNEILDIVNIGTDTLDMSFSIQSEDCSDKLLVPISTVSTSLCTISLKFLPFTTGMFTSDLVIEYESQVSGESFFVKYPLIGEGGVPAIGIADTFDLTSQVGGFDTTRDIVVTNLGQASLQVFSISGLISTNFSQTNDCIGDDVFIAPGETCAISVNFITSEFGTKVAALTIETDDPVNNILNVTLSGHGEDDADGISTVIEDAAPNAGDNDINGTPDSLQNDVASYISRTGEYISLVVDVKNVVSNAVLLPDGQLDDSPINVVFNHGVHVYDVAIDSNLVDTSPFGAIIEIGFILPSGDALEGYYFYGETTDNATPHWYLYEAQRVLARASTADSTGKQFVRDFIKITVQDGGRGDADKVVNGRIVLAPGAAAYLVNGSDESGSGALNFQFLCFLIVFLIMVNRSNFVARY